MKERDTLLCCHILRLLIQLDTSSVELLLKIVILHLIVHLPIPPSQCRLRLFHIHVPG